MLANSIKLHLKGKNSKILVVEDKKSFLPLLERGLSWTVITLILSTTALQALEMAQLEQYDLILLLTLTFLVSTGLICYVRYALGGHSETKVLILSARSSVSDRIVGLDAGAV